MTETKQENKIKKPIFLQLITNNTGVSVKSFMLLWGAMISTFIMIVILSFEWYLLTHPDIDYRPNYVGISAVITATGTMIAAIVWGKVKDSGSSDSQFGTSLNKEL